MITVTIRRDGANRIRGVRVTGHSGTEERGRDIVCAAVSAIVQTALIGLSDVAGLDISPKIEDGLIALDIPQAAGSQGVKADAILETMALGLESARQAAHGAIRINGGERYV